MSSTASSITHTGIYFTISAGSNPIDTACTYNVERYGSSVESGSRIFTPYGSNAVSYSTTTGGNYRLLTYAYITNGVNNNYAFNSNTTYSSNTMIYAAQP